MGINRLDLKQSNAQTILKNLSSCKTCTIKEIAQATGLSFATVGNTLNRFVETGEVILGEMLSDTGGRPSQFYNFNAEYAHVLALSARILKGKNLIHACVANLYGEIVWQTEQCFDTIQLASFEAVIEESLKRYATIRVLSFALPGVECNGVILTNDYTELQGISFTKHFEEKYSLSVIIENDVNAAVFGFHQIENTDSATVGIYFPKYFYPGAGIVIDGKIVTGACGFAGEVSLIPMDLDWLSLNYENPKEAGGAVAKLISVFCGIVNPKDMVLYGDFFTNSLKEIVMQKIPTQTMQHLLPKIIYKEDLNPDIITGLVMKAISVYQRVG